MTKTNASLRLSFFCAISLFTLYSCQEDDNQLEPCPERIWYQDADQDGLGNPAVSISDCEQPTGYVANNRDNNDNEVDDNDNDPTGAVERAFAGRIDLNDLYNYADQDIPSYIEEDNTGGNQITDAGATLGRVLFYDKNLSSDFSTSCATCHKQEFAFADNEVLSQGANGLTGRHSMRLINARFARERRFFWDERANSLETQTTMPIQDHFEMGFSGQNGDPSLNDLIERLEGIDYYQELFEFVYGDAQVTEDRMQRALAQFIRSIQSFDSKYDAGRTQVNNNNTPFPNFSNLENQGKQLFGQGAQFNQNGMRIGGGLGCQRCHGAPEFDITPNSDNNGVITVAGNPNAVDLDVTRSPSLRDLFNTNGLINSPMMHDGSMATIDIVLDHYNEIPFNPQVNNNLDNRLRPQGRPQRLQMTNQEREAITAFLQTLSGSDVYTNEMWSDPFQL